MITRDEVFKLARMAHIAVTDEEVTILAEQLASVLTYAGRVTENANYVLHDEQKPCNVFREDQPQRTDPAPILALAPQSAEHFFVVPTILKK
ncbi:aspartyl/glutamyl-tRNA amidotransferase subunit C [Candidatus Dependentiae bacterium]|nr:aspartyl/glutamyl-tRNA amidotransferase subunit C [Candidatus Dependentiae bacterium]